MAALSRQLAVLLLMLGSLLAQARETVAGLDPMVAAHRDAHGQDAGDFAIEHLACQPVRGNAVTHQPAQLSLRLVQGDGKSHAAQLKRGGQA